MDTERSERRKKLHAKKRRIDELNSKSGGRVIADTRANNKDSMRSGHNSPSSAEAPEKNWQDDFLDFFATIDQDGLKQVDKTATNRTEDVKVLMEETRSGQTGIQRKGDNNNINLGRMASEGNRDEGLVHKLDRFLLQQQPDISHCVTQSNKKEDYGDDADVGVPRFEHSISMGHTNSNKKPLKGVLKRGDEKVSEVTSAALPLMAFC